MRACFLGGAASASTPLREALRAGFTDGDSSLSRLAAALALSLAASSFASASFLAIIDLMSLGVFGTASLARATLNVGSIAPSCGTFHSEAGGVFDARLG